MSSTTRQLQSINGVTVTPPTQTGFTSNTMEVYPDDAAFLVAHPTPTEGQFYWNSTEKLVRQYNGTSFQYDKTAFSVQTDSTSTGADQDITPTAGSQVIRFTGGSLTSIRGINPALQKQVFLVNDQAANGIVLRNESAGATAANRIRTGNGQDITLRTNQTVSLLYDTATSRWRVLGLSNVRSVEAFVNDAAFAAAHAPPVIGDRYWNTTDLVMKQFDGAAWSNNKVSFSTQVNATLTGANQDLVPNLDQTIRLTNGSLTSIRSISPAIQKLIYIVNGQASPITLKNEDATATAANRIATPTGSDFSLAPGQALALIYETGSSRWRFAGGGSGGGLTPIAASGALTAQAGFHYLTDTTAASFSITLPAGATGATLKFTDATEKWGTNNLTLIPATGEKIDQLAINETLVCDVVRGWVELNWSGTYWAFNSLASTQVAEASATAPGIVSTGAQSFAGAKTFLGALTPSGGIVGNTSGATVGPGLIGEVSRLNGTTVHPASGLSNMATFTLGAGAWLISAHLQVTNNGSGTAWNANNTPGLAISRVSGSFSGTSSGLNNMQMQAVTGSAGLHTAALTISNYYVNLTTADAANPFYLVVNNNYASGNPTNNWGYSAVRVLS